MHEFEELNMKGDQKESRHDSWARVHEDPLFQIKKAERNFARLKHRNPIKAMLLEAEAMGKKITLTPQQQAQLQSDTRHEIKRAEREERLKKLGLGQMIDGTPAAFVGKHLPRIDKFRDMIATSMDALAEENTKLGFATAGRTKFMRELKEKSGEKRRKKEKHRHEKERHRKRRHRRRHSSEENREEEFQKEGLEKSVAKKPSKTESKSGDTQSRVFNSVKDLAEETTTDENSPYFECKFPDCAWRSKDKNLTAMHEEQHQMVFDAENMDTEEALEKVKDDLANILREAGKLEEGEEVNMNDIKFDAHRRDQTVHAKLAEEEEPKTNAQIAADKAIAAAGESSSQYYY